MSTILLEQQGSDGTGQRRRLHPLSRQLVV